MTDTTSCYTTAGTTTSVWRIWTTGTASCITTGTNDGVWDAWNTTTATSVTTSSATNGIWVQWVNTAATLADVRPHGLPIRQSFSETPEMVADRERRAAERRRLDEEARRETMRAEERARQLLVSILDAQQQRDLAAHEHFFVDAPSGRRYRIDKGRSGNVKVVDRATGVWVESLCIHQNDYVPVYDTMVMQKLLIETAEDEFRACANITKKDGGYDSSRGGLLTGERLANILPFRARAEAQAAA